MAVVKISKFGGIMPSVDPRNLPAEGAQTAHNLDMRFGDFRPLRDVGSPVPGATVVAGAKTIFRTPSGVWLSTTNDANFVNGQINDAATERVYATGRNASYPEVWQGGSYYRLGVPAPATAPTLAVVAQDEFLQSDRDAAASAIIATVTDYIRTSAALIYLGTAPSGTGLSGGWLAHNAATGLPTPTADYVAYAVAATGTAASPTITAVSDGYLTNPALAGKFVTVGIDTKWAVGMLWYATSYSINTTALATSIQTIIKPTTVADPLFSASQASAIAQRVADLIDPTKDPVRGLLNTVTQRQGEVTSQLQRTDTNADRASALAAAISALAATVRALNSYVLGVSESLSSYAGKILTGYAELLPDAVTRVLETRAYIYTYVNSWGEESAPSPASELIELDQNDHVNVTCYQTTVPADATGTVPITKFRIYRSSTTTSGAEYQLVSEVNYFAINFAQLDTKLQEALEETCPTITWAFPESTLKGLVGLPNGVMAAFYGKTLYFCEPFHPYAWPVEYQHTLEYNIVGLGTFGQTLVVLTEGNPYYFSGADSATMSGQKMESVQSCVSKRSIVSVEGGVIYASPDGICIASPQGVDLATLGAYDKFDWQALGLTNSFAAFSEGVYYIFTEN